MSNIIKGSGIIYTTGQPNTIPSVGTDAEFAIDVNGVQYAWNRDSGVWDNIGQGIEISNSNDVPSNTPTKFKPRFVVTPDRTLYFYSGSWGKVNPLPSGLFSSSAQVGRTGIYSGSGTLSGTTIVDNLGAFPFRIETISDDENFKFVLNPSNEIFLGQNNGCNIQIAFDPYMKIGTPINYIAIDPYDTLYNSSGMRIVDENAEPRGLEYASDYNTFIKTNDRSIPDVGTIRNHLTASYANNGRIYKVLALRISQSGGTESPSVENIFQNDYTGLTISGSRVGQGIYNLHFNQNILQEEKTVTLTNLPPSTSDYTTIKTAYIADNILEIQSLSGTSHVELFTEYPLFMEIRTYG